MSFFIFEICVTIPEVHPWKKWFWSKPSPGRPKKKFYFHTKVPCKNPNELVKCRPDRVSCSGLELYCGNGKWIFHEDFQVWIMRVYWDEEDYTKLKDVLEEKWQKGPYEGEKTADPFRSESV